MKDTDRTQAQIAALDFARAIREQFAGVDVQEVASAWEKLANDLAEHLPAGDYDVLVARKLKAATELIRSGIASREMLESELRKFFDELREAFGEKQPS